jgi:hypothetical protein
VSSRTARDIQRSPVSKKQTKKKKKEKRKNNNKQKSQALGGESAQDLMGVGIQIDRPSGPKRE